VGSLGYDYNDTYLLNGSFRYDGSVIFAPERRWGFFPSLSAGWRISNEPFFKVGFIDDLKLRASYAMLGNDAVGSFQWLQSYDIEDGAIFDSPSVGLRPGTLANRAITWEKSKSYDVGLDAAFWDRTVDLTLDYFRRNTYDILGSRQEIIPSTFGASLPDENYERINSHGYEASLGYNGHFGRGSGALDYHVRGNFGYATNSIAVLDEAENIRAYQSRIGRSTDAEFGYIATGILRTQADLDALPEGYTILGEKPRLGMLNYRDLRGPNSDDPDGRITSDDQDWIGAHSDPPINYGFQVGGSWKALSLETLFQGVAGNRLMMQTNGRDIQARIEESSYGYWADSWTPDNPDGAYPGYRGTNYRTRFPESSFWLRSGSFLRLKSVTLSYELPDGLLGGLGANGARLYATATNPVLVYDRLGDWGYDPEASNIRAYPLMKTFTLGVSISH
jgi:TonB-linked SusC/RagA family outer membrane protein